MSKSTGKKKLEFTFKGKKYWVDWEEYLKREAHEHPAKESAS